jgi:hypothetical protein
MSFEHLKKINQTYLTHFQDALYYSVLSFKASICFLIHGIYPDILESSGSKTIFDLNGAIKEKYEQNKK